MYNSVCTFQEYFEVRVGRPFTTWAQLENTYHYAQRFAPQLLKKTFGDAQAARQRYDDDKAQQREAGNPSDMHDERGRFSRSEPIVDNVHNWSDRPSGNSESAAFRRLDKDRPDLLERVLDGELTANAAMKQAGFRPHSFTIRVTTPESIAATLIRQLPPDLLQKVVGRLTDE